MKIPYAYLEYILIQNYFEYKKDKFVEEMCGKLKLKISLLLTDYFSP